MRKQLEQIELQLEEINAASVLKRPAMAQRLVADVVHLQHQMVNGILDLHRRLAALEEKQ